MELLKLGKDGEHILQELNMKFQGKPIDVVKSEIGCEMDKIYRQICEEGVSLQESGLFMQKLWESIREAMDAK